MEEGGRLSVPGASKDWFSWWVWLLKTYKSDSLSWILGELWRCGAKAGKEPERERGGLHTTSKTALPWRRRCPQSSHWRCWSWSLREPRSGRPHEWRVWQVRHEQEDPFERRRRQTEVLKELIEGSLQLYEEVRKMKEDHAEGCTEETSFKEERWKKIQEDPRLREVVVTGKLEGGIWWICDKSKISAWVTWVSMILLVT